MALDMMHVNEIARAVRLLCQSGVPLREDCLASDEVVVGSNELFEIGDDVELLDEDTAAEQRTVVGKSGLTVLRLNQPVAGAYEVAKHAWIRLATPRLTDVQFVAQGRPDLVPEPRGERFPCIVVQPGLVRQLGNEGPNKAFPQEYDFHVFYIRKHVPGEEAGIRALDEAAALFNLLMEDTYLGGTCWYSQVTRLDPDDPVGAGFRERRVPLDVIRLDLTARRLEPWPK
jgi:hypothetical protein